MRDKERKREIESLLGGIEDERFALLVNLGKKITDWSNDELKRSGNRNGEAMDTDDIDENIGVRVMIGDEDDEEEDEEVYEVNDGDREDEEDDQAEDSKHQIISGKGISEESAVESKSKSLQPHQIDAFWLQRKLSTVYDDPTQAQTKVKEVCWVWDSG